MIYKKNAELCAAFESDIEIRAHRHHVYFFFSSLNAIGNKEKEKKLGVTIFPVKTKQKRI